VSEDRSSAGRLEAVVHGRVQGVGFRVFVARRARSMGLAGWVENQARGSVRVVAEGPADALEALLEALRDGPPGAWVDRVDVARPAATGELGSFEIRTGWHRGD
jgi:acylphosphatase